MFKRSLLNDDGVITVRCFAFQAGDQVIASCVDLCLSAQGQTLVEAKGKLHDQVVDYLYDAASEGNLESRPSPFGHWVRYYVGVLGLKARAHVDGLLETFRETVRLDAIPA